MHIYAQHGYGKADKIEKSMRKGYISGVILSPRDEHPDKILEYIGNLRDEFRNDIILLFDPQFYATTLSPVIDKYLPDYPYYKSGLTHGNFIAQADIHRYVSDTLQYQAKLGLDRLISPSILFNDFSDRWSQISLIMARESIAFHEQMKNAPPLLLSIIIDEHSLQNKDALDEFLNIISIWEVSGYYLNVRLHNPIYPAHFDEESSLINLLYFVYVLAEINEFEVVCGYSDLVGLLLLAVGAKAIGTGWFHTLRQFSLNRFIPSIGGRQARPRYTSSQLLNSILIDPELETIYRLHLLNRVLSNSSYDSVMNSNNPVKADWPPDISCLHHWEVLKRISNELFSRGSVSQRIAFLEEKIKYGITLYNNLDKKGVPFDTPTGPRNLQQWLQAINNFRREAKI